jgi:hypothetical protein
MDAIVLHLHCTVTAAVETVTPMATAPPALFEIVIVHVPAPIGVTVYDVGAEFAFATTFAIVPESGEHVSLSVNPPV